MGANDPVGPPNGYWHPQHGGGWSWVGNQSPPQYLVDDYGLDKITNIKETPQGVANPNYDPNPAPPDVTTPTLTQVWNTAPHLPGDKSQQPVGGPPGGSSTPPPPHTAYLVSPGGIRDAEDTLLTETQGQVNYYQDFKDYVNSTKDWVFAVTDPSVLNPVTRRNGPPAPLYGTPNQAVTNKMMSIQDNALKQVADTIELVGEYIGALNNSAQSYVQADIKSTLPAP